MPRVAFRTARRSRSTASRASFVGCDNPHSSWLKACLPGPTRSLRSCLEGVNHLVRLVSIGRNFGNREEKGAPPSQCAVCPDAAAVRFDDALGDGEPEPGAEAPLSWHDLPESVEDTRQILRCDAAARVGNPKEHVLISRACANRDATAGFREFESVANEILEHLVEAPPARPEIVHTARHVDSELDPR